MEFCGVWAKISILLVSLAPALVFSDGEPNVMADYCEDASFKAHCPDGEVVVMRTALYGRMAVGECLSGDYGSIGCNSDVMQVMDNWCSGRRTCEVQVRDLFMKAQGKCTAELRGYLRANYTCQKVVRPFGECCRDDNKVAIKDQSGFLASSITDETGCGSIDCPWYIEAAKGQKVNITLFDFGVPSQASPSGPRTSVCHVYAIIKEKQTAVTMTVCAGEERVRMIHLTTSNSVEIRVVTKKRSQEDLTFMLKYEAIGCPDIEAPPNGLVERHGNRATVSCHGDGGGSWQVVCQGSQWTGRMENCSANIGSVRGVLGDIFTLTPDVSIVIIIIVAMIIAVVILMVGVFCLRRRWLQNNHLQNHQKRPLPNPIEDPRRETGYIMRDNKSLGENTYPREHNYFRTWELQRHPARVPIPAELPVDSQDYSRRYVDHIYESPTFSRRDIHEDGTQYFELDPDAEPFYPGAPGAPGAPGVSMRHQPPPPPPNPAPIFLNNVKQQRCSFPESTVHDHKSNIGSFTS